MAASASWRDAVDRLPVCLLALFAELETRTSDFGLAIGAWTSGIAQAASAARALHFDPHRLDRDMAAPALTVIEVALGQLVKQAVQQAGELLIGASGSEFAGY